MKRIKTGFLERRLELAKAGFISGSSYLTQSALNYMLPPSQRDQAQKELLTRQANFLVEELGKLKGSVVKIGQMLALYGEYFLPEEVTAALHKLEDSTEPLEWPSILSVLQSELGEAKLAGLDIVETPIASASLSQVHLAYDKRSGKQLCLKVQYPNVADAIDADFDAVIHLLRLSSMITGKRNLEPLLTEIKALLQQEIDYHIEAKQTKQAALLLAGNRRFVVPNVIDNLSTAKVLALSYETGSPVTDESITQLSLSRRNQLGEAMLELFLLESTQWGVMQADPNFGNFLIRAGDKQEDDKIVLLDFGAIKQLGEDFRNPFIQLIKAAHYQDIEAVINNSIKMDLMHGSAPKQALREFADIIIAIVEPLHANPSELPESVLNDSGEYLWRSSNLPRRVAKRAVTASLSRHFAMPPVEFLLLMRKLTGIYSFISALDSQFNGAPTLEPYLRHSTSADSATGGQLCS